MILVTGGTGLLGSHLLYELLSKDVRVKVLIRSSSKKEEILTTFGYYTSNPDVLFEKIEWAEGDITDIQSVKEAMEGVSKVYHTAAFVSFNPKDKYKIYKINIQGTANVVNVCLEMGVKKLCFVSSIASLGNTDNGAEIDENVLWKPTKNASAYSISKFKSEMEVWRGINEGLPAVIVNPSIILGPGHWNSGSSSFFPSVANGFKYYTHGVNGYVDVRDVARIMVELMESNIVAERFVLSSQNLDYKEFLTKVANVLQVDPPKVFATPFLANLAWRLEAVRSKLLFSNPKITEANIVSSYKKLYYNNSKVRETLHTEFRSVDESISEIAKFYKQDLVG